MVWSKYNRFFKTDSEFLIYNSMSNSFAELNKETYYYLIDKESNNDDDIDDSDLKKVLLDMKVLIENEKDEFNELKYLANLKRYNDRVLNLTINPTLNCNFSCEYCYEKNRTSIYMSEKVENDIINYIKSKKQVEFINITWFGGEPLLAFDRIESLTNKIKKINIKFIAGIITNGFLLTHSVSDKLKDLQIENMQITIDGLADVHNSRRHLTSGAGTFNRIIDNIDYMKKKNPDLRLSIRVNIDENNKDEFVKVYELFKEKKFKNLYVSPAFVDDISGNYNPCLFDRNRKVKFLIDLKNKCDIDISYLYYPDSRYECGIRNINTLVIGPEGEIYKCWNDVGIKDQIVGSLDNSIKPNNRLMLRYLVGSDPFDDEKCKSCFHFPTCGGGCPYLRIKNEYEGYNFNTCCYSKDYLEDFLKIHYLYKKAKTNV